MLVLNGHRQEPLHRALIVDVLSQATTSRDLLGQIAALAHLSWHGVGPLTEFYTMCLDSRQSGYGLTWLRSLEDVAKNKRHCRHSDTIGFSNRAPERRAVCSLTAVDARYAELTAP